MGRQSKQEFRTWESKRRKCPYVVVDRPLYHDQGILTELNGIDIDLYLIALSSMHGRKKKPSKDYENIKKSDHSIIYLDQKGLSHRIQQSQPNISRSIKKLCSRGILKVMPLARIGKKTVYRVTELHESGYRHISIPENLINSASWQALTAPAKLLYFACKEVYWLAKKTGRMTLIYKAIRKHFGWCWSKPKYYRAIKELIKYGFIEIERKGANRSTPTIYKMSEKWKGQEEQQEQTPPKAGKDTRKTRKQKAPQIAKTAQKKTDTANENKQPKETKTPKMPFKKTLEQLKEEKPQRNQYRTEEEYINATKSWNYNCAMLLNEAGL